MACFVSIKKNTFSTSQFYELFKTQNEFVAQIGGKKMAGPVLGRELGPVLVGNEEDGWLVSLSRPWMDRHRRLRLSQICHDEGSPPPTTPPPPRAPPLPHSLQEGAALPFPSTSQDLSPNPRTPHGRPPSLGAPARGSSRSTVSRAFRPPAPRARSLASAAPNLLPEAQRR